MKLALSAAMIAAAAALASGCATTDPTDAQQAEADGKVRTGSVFERREPTGRALRTTSGQAYRESDRTSVITRQDPNTK
jgi:type IV pilus biogenesis protein CpaD/CtpE